MPTNVSRVAKSEKTSEIPLLLLATAFLIAYAWPVLTTAGDALWWACTTVTTVGYGDLYPVTVQGRVIAVALMLVGIAVVGSVTAIIATWLIENVQDQDEASGVTAW